MPVRLESSRYGSQYYVKTSYFDRGEKQRLTFNEHAMICCKQTETLLYGT